MQPSDWLESHDDVDNNQNTTHANDDPVVSASPQPGLSAPITASPSDENTTTEQIVIDLDTDVLEILGDDPSSAVKYGPKIRDELVNRLLHVATEGLSKEVRKDLLSKYLTPSNCLQIDAPKLNPEIKAAIADTAVKRDKGIETKQRQLASALSCLSNVINTQIGSKTKNNDVLQKLMDISRLLCDIQYADSITRRNFILFALKQDMKEHLKTTKIDTFLFGNDLAETLKSAKAVNKSGIDLKADSANKIAANKFKTAGQRPLNRRAPAQARRPPGQALPPAPAQRSRESARPRAPPPPPPSRPAYSSKTSSSQQQYYPRRRY